MSSAGIQFFSRPKTDTSSSQPMNKKNAAEEEFHFFWFGPFSQWHACSFFVEDIQYNCAEQFMMAQKALLFGDKASHRLIMASKDPKIQKGYGRNVTPFDPNTWEQHDVAIVKKGNFEKFSQNAALLKLLIETEGTTLVEASPYDSVWGIKLKENDPRARNRATWQGQNKLGQILTELRDEFILDKTFVEAATSKM